MRPHNYNHGRCTVCQAFTARLAEDETECPGPDDERAIAGSEFIPVPHGVRTVHPLADDGSSMAPVALTASLPLPGHPGHDEAYAELKECLHRWGFDPAPDVRDWGTGPGQLRRDCGHEQPAAGECAWCIIDGRPDEPLSVAALSALVVGRACEWRRAMRAMTSAKTRALFDAIDAYIQRRDEVMAPPDHSFGGCTAVGVAGIHSDSYGEYGGCCNWCGAVKEGK